MRKSVILLAGILVASVAWSAAAEAKAGPRTQQATYSTPAAGLAGQGAFGACSSEDGFGCVSFFTSKSDKHVTIKITDTSGQPVFATVVQEKSSAGGYDPLQGNQKGSFCGKTKKPITITGGQALQVFLYEGPGPDGCPGVATQGVVTATFSK